MMMTMMMTMVEEKECGDISLKICLVGEKNLFCNLFIFFGQILFKLWEKECCDIVSGVKLLLKSGEALRVYGCAEFSPYTLTLWHLMRGYTPVMFHFIQSSAQVSTDRIFHSLWKYKLLISELVLPKLHFWDKNQVQSRNMCLLMHKWLLWLLSSSCFKIEMRTIWDLLVTKLEQMSYGGS